MKLSSKPMRSIILAIVLSAVVGTAIGASIAWLDVGTAIPPLPETASPSVQGVPDEASSAKFPKFEVDSLEYKFGSMQRGTRRKHTFVVSNSGEAPLRLVVGKPSCKCTVGELEKDVLNPGESVNLKVEWVAKVPEGPFRQWVPITTNDPTNSSVELTVVGEVAVPMGLVPRELAFGRVRYGQESSAEVVFLSFVQDSIEVESAEINRVQDKDQFDIQVEPVAIEDLPTPNAKAGVRIKVTAKSTMPVGGFVQWIVLKTNLEDSEEIEIPLIGRVVGDISVAGQGYISDHDTLRMGRILSSEGKKSELKIIVRSEETGDVQFEVAEVEPKDLRATLGEPRRIKSVVHVPLTIEVPQGTRSMVHMNPDTDDAAYVKIQTSHPQAPELMVNLRFAVE